MLWLVVDLVRKREIIVIGFVQRLLCIIMLGYYFLIRSHYEILMIVAVGECLLEHLGRRLLNQRRRIVVA